MAEPTSHPRALCLLVTLGVGLLLAPGCGGRTLGGVGVQDGGASHDGSTPPLDGSILVADGQVPTGTNGYVLMERRTEPGE